MPLIWKIVIFAQLAEEEKKLLKKQSCMEQESFDSEY